MTKLHGDHPLLCLAGTADQPAVSARNGRDTVRADHLAVVDFVHAVDRAVAQALEHTVLGVGAGEQAAGARPYGTALHVVAGVVAVAPAGRATGRAVVADNVAAIATIGRAVGCIVAAEVAIVATDVATAS